MPISRRRFVQGMGFAAAALGSGFEVFADAGGAGPTPTPAGPIPPALVLIQLAGGNDGLNTIVPANDGLYRQLRPTLGLNAEELRPLGTGDLSIHASLAKLLPRFASGEVAIVQGIGYPKSSRSHFESSAVWQTGRLDGEGDGWLGRAGPARLTGNFARLGVGGGSLTPALYGTIAPATALASLDAFAAQPDKRFPGDGPALLRALSATYAASPHAMHGFAAPIRAVGESALRSSEALKAAVNQYTSMVTYPRGGFGDQLKLTAQLLGARLGVRIAHLTLGGFDTHANQKRQQSALFTTLAEGITALLDDCQAHGLGDRVTVMTYSEFGRRVAENASSGTDHGAGSVLLLVGSRVKGGLHGNAPDLSKLDGGDVAATVDFRAVYAAALRDGLGVDPEPVLGKQKPLEVFKT